jgi:hypothetical protein
MRKSNTNYSSNGAKNRGGVNVKIAVFGLSALGGVLAVACSTSSDSGVGSDAGGIRKIECDVTKFNSAANPDLKVQGVQELQCQPGREGFCGDPPYFCVQRVMSDIWPGTEDRQSHCTIRCESEAECVSGSSCCEVRLGTFCMNPGKTDPCERHCPTNDSCPEGKICCEKLGKICVSQHCSGVCAK